MCLLQFIRSPWKQVLVSLNSLGASFNLSGFCFSIATFDRFGNFLLTLSTDNFPWEGCTVVGQVSELHLRGSPALFAKAIPFVMIFQMPHIYLDKHQGIKDMSEKKFYIYLVDLPFSEALIPVDSFEVGDNFAHLFWSSTLVFVSFRWLTFFCQNMSYI